MKTTDFITENQFIGDDAHAMHQDHEVQMARSDCYSSAKYAIELHKLLKNVSEMQGLDGWVSEKLTLANDYLRTVHEYLTHDMSHPEEAMPEMFTAESAEIQFAELLGEGGRLDLSSPEEKAARKAYIKAHGHPPPLTPDSVVAKYNPGDDIKVRDYYLRRKGIPQDKLDKMKEDGVAEASPRQHPKRYQSAIDAFNRFMDEPESTPKDELQSRHDQTKKRIKTNTMAGPKGQLPEAGPGDINRLEHRGEEYNVYFNQRKGMYTARGTGQMKGQIQPEWFHTLADAIDHAEMEIGGYDEHDGVAEGSISDLLNQDPTSPKFNDHPGASQLKKSEGDPKPVTTGHFADKKGQPKPYPKLKNTSTGKVRAHPNDHDQGVAESDPLANRDAYAKQHQQGQVYKTHYPKGENPFHKAGMKDKRSTKMSAYDISNTGPKGQLPESDVVEGSISDLLNQDPTSPKFNDHPGASQLKKAKGQNEFTGTLDSKGRFTKGTVKNMFGKLSPDAKGVTETTSSAGMATAPGVGKGPATGTLFGGSYAPKTPFTGKKKAKTSVIKR
jgi:hypothetical protein